MAQPSSRTHLAGSLQPWIWQAAYAMVLKNNSAKRARLRFNRSISVYMNGQGKKYPSGDLIAAARRAIRMTQVDLAQASGVTDRTIAALEAGKTTPHPTTLGALVDALEKRGIVFTNGDRPGFYIDKSKIAEAKTAPDSPSG